MDLKVWWNKITFSRFTDRKNAQYKTANYHKQKFRPAGKTLPNFDESFYHKIVLPVTQCSTSVHTAIVLFLLYTLTTQEIKQSSTACVRIGLTRRISARILCPTVCCKWHVLLPSFLKTGCKRKKSLCPEFAKDPNGNAALYAKNGNEMHLN